MRSPPIDPTHAHNEMFLIRSQWYILASPKGGSRKSSESATGGASEESRDGACNRNELIRPMTVTAAAAGWRWSNSTTRGI